MAFKLDSGTQNIVLSWSGTIHYQHRLEFGQADSNPLVGLYWSGDDPDDGDIAIYPVTVDFVFTGPGPGGWTYDHPDWLATYFDEYGVLLPEYADIDIGEATCKLTVKCADSIESLYYTWAVTYNPSVGYEDDSKDIPFDVSVTIPVEVWGSIDDVGEIGSVLADGKIWKPYITARNACWVIDSKLTISYEQADDITIACEIGDQSDSYTRSTGYGAPQGWMKANVIPNTDNSTGDDWGEVVSITFARTNMGNPTFGTGSYEDGNGYECINLNGTTVKVLMPADGEPHESFAPFFTHLVGAFDVTYSGAVRYLEGKALAGAQITTSEELPEWNETEQEWQYADDGSSVIDATGDVFSYGGWWTLSGIQGVTGDYMDSSSTALYKSLPINCDEDERTHGPSQVVTPANLGQPDYPTPSGVVNGDFADDRVLFKHDVAATKIADAYEVTAESSPVEVCEFPYSDHASWVLSDPSHFSLADSGGNLQITCNDAGGTIEIPYSVCRSSVDARYDTWLGARFAKLIFTSSTNDEFNIEIAGRTYGVSADKPQFDLLACSEAAPDPPTLSLLPTFLPETTDASGNPDPPTVTDIPNDWGVYQPGTITLSGMKAGETYTLEALQLVAVNAPEVVICQGEWVQWEPDEYRDWGTDSTPFHDAGTGGTASNPTSFMAMRVGYVLQDGVIAAEIIGVLHRRYSDAGDIVYDVRYPWFVGAVPGTLGENYAAFPHADLPLLSIAVDTSAGPSGYGWGAWWDSESEDLDTVPLAYLWPGKHSSAIDAILSVAQYVVPANYGDITISHYLEYGALGLVRVADTARLGQQRSLGITTFNEGSPSPQTDATGTYLTWGDDEASLTLSQYNPAHTRHQMSVTVLDGDGGSQSVECRNRMLTLALIKSAASSAAGADSVDILVDRLTGVGLMSYVDSGALYTAVTFDYGANWQSPKQITDASSPEDPCVYLLPDAKRSWGVAWTDGSDVKTAVSSNNFATWEVDTLASGIEHCRIVTHPVSGITMLIGWQTSTGKLVAFTSYDYGATFGSAVDIATAPEQAVGLTCVPDAQSSWQVAFADASSNILHYRSSDNGGTWAAI